MAALPRISEGPGVPLEGWRYLIALGSNVPHPRHGPPRRVLGAALVVLAEAGLRVERASPLVESAPLGPSRRRYGNGVAIVATPLAPPGLLALLKQVESAFGRRSGGRRWRARVLDLDIVLWSGGLWPRRCGRGGLTANRGQARSAGQGAPGRLPWLAIPHPAFRERGFVLGPARRIAADWRDPVGGRSVACLHARLTRPRPALR